MNQVWDIRTHKLKEDLPGHADEVLYAKIIIEFYEHKAQLPCN